MKDGAYSLTRHNSLKWAIAVDGPMACMGEKCVYREECGVPDDQLPEMGQSCPVETTYANQIEFEFRRDYGYLAGGACLDEFDDLVAEAVNVTLARARVTTRANRAWSLTDDRGNLTERAFREFELCDRYYEALANRWMTVLERLKQASVRHAERERRLHLIFWGNKIQLSPREGTPQSTGG